MLRGRPARMGGGVRAMEVGTGERPDDDAREGKVGEEGRKARDRDVRGEIRTHATNVRVGAALELSSTIATELVSRTATYFSLAIERLANWRRMFWSMFFSGSCEEQAEGDATQSEPMNRQNLDERGIPSVGNESWSSARDHFFQKTHWNPKSLTQTTGSRAFRHSKARTLHGHDLLTYVGKLAQCDALRALGCRHPASEIGKRNQISSESRRCHDQQTKLASVDSLCLDGKGRQRWSIAFLR